MRLGLSPSYDSSAANPAAALYAHGGVEGIRTLNLLTASQMLFQLSYNPRCDRRQLRSETPVTCVCSELLPHLMVCRRKG